MRERSVAAIMKTIHHVCDIEASIDAVWAALTTESGLASWWSTRVVAPPPAVGATLHFTFRGDFNPDIRIEELKPKTMLIWRCVGGHKNWDDGTFRFELEPTSSSTTRLRFWQYYAVELADDYYGIYNFNRGYYLESLSQYCSTGKGSPCIASGTL
jgi:uncharacterized protein YndB with AHSA1/START domain